MKPRRLMSARAAARHVGVRDETFRAYVRLGVIPKWTDPVTGRVRFSVAVLDDWLRTRIDQEAS